MGERRKKGTIVPKNILIVEPKGGDANYKLCKVWPGGKVGEPYIITDILKELVDEYEAGCKKWSIKPDIKRIKLLIKNEEQNDVTHGKQQGNFLKMH